MGDKKIGLYLANQLGFSETGRIALNIFIITKLEQIGYKVWEPFREGAKYLDIEHINSLNTYEERRKAFAIANQKIARNNIIMPSKSKVMAPILDGGHSVDDGVAGELGEYYARGYGPIIALRTDFRLSENIGCLVNLQLEKYIKKSGGKICASMNEWYAKLERVYKQLKK